MPGKDAGELKMSLEAAILGGPSAVDRTEAARLLAIDAYARRWPRSVAVGAILATIGIPPAHVALARRLRSRPGVAFLALVEGWDLRQIVRECY